MQKNITLSNGSNMPVIGLGTWMSQPGKVGQAVRYALLEAGYKHVDCAKAYGNEEEIGAALTDVFKKIPRQDIFLTSKLWNTDHQPDDVEKACRKTLKDLGVEYLDLYLMHWGIAFKSGNNTDPKDERGKIIRSPISVQETWKSLEKLQEKGLVKSIGVANFSTIMLVDLLTYAKIKPSMNQIELHPFNTQEELITFCKDNNIAVTAYSPLGRQGENTQGPKLFDEPLIKDLATKYKKTASQILLNWAIERGTVVIPKSVTPERIKENIEIFDFSLSEDDVLNISSLNKNLRFVNPNQAWGIPVFA